MKLNYEVQEILIPAGLHRMRITACSVLPCSTSGALAAHADVNVCEECSIHIPLLALTVRVPFPTKLFWGNNATTLQDYKLLELLIEARLYPESDLERLIEACGFGSPRRAGVFDTEDLVGGSFIGKITHEEHDGHQFESVEFPEQAEIQDWIDNVGYREHGARVPIQKAARPSLVLPRPPSAPSVPPPQPQPTPRRRS